MGYLGGVSWAILVAKICQMFPLSQPSKLLEYFFTVYENWNWPKPVLMGQEPIACAQNIWEPETDCVAEEWSMPIMTPCYPSTNTSFNVNRTTQRIILDAFRRAKRIYKRIRTQDAGWRDLFEKFNFFNG